MIAYLEKHDTTVELPNDLGEKDIADINQNFERYVQPPDQTPAATPAEIPRPSNSTIQVPKTPIPTGIPGVDVPQSTNGLPNMPKWVPDFYESYIKPSINALGPAGLPAQLESLPESQRGPAEAFSTSALKQLTAGMATPILAGADQEEKDHPIASFGGALTGGLGGLLATGGALRIAGLEPLAEEAGKAGVEAGMASAQRYLPRAIMTGATFGTQAFVTHVVKAFQDGNVDLAQFGKDVLLQTAGGATFGAIGGVANVPLSVASAGGVGFLMSKMEGGDNKEAALNAGLFAGFEFIGSFGKNETLVKEGIGHIEASIDDYVKAKNPDLAPNGGAGHAIVTLEAQKYGGIDEMAKKENALQLVEDINQRIRQGKIPNPIQEAEQRPQVSGPSPETVPETNQPTGQLPTAASSPASPQPTGASLERPPGTRYGAAQTQGSIFPATQISSNPSIAQHPDYIQMTKDAEAVVSKYAEKMGVEPSAQLGESIFRAIHTDQNNTAMAMRNAKTPEEMQQIKYEFDKRWPDADREFATLHSKLYSDVTEGWFERNEAGKYGGMRAQVALDAEKQSEFEQHVQTFKEMDPEQVPQDLRDIWHRQQIELEKKEKVSSPLRDASNVISKVVTPAGETVKITHNMILNEAKGLHQQALDERGVSELEKFISGNPIRAERESDTKEEDQSIPVRFKDKNGATIDERAQQAYDRGLIEDPNGDLLRNALRDLPIRGKAPRLSDFYDEAQRSLEHWYSTIPEVNFSMVPGKKQTDTPQFKKWFGDSKVVDANGNPLVVYHGTTKDFVKFDKKMATMGGITWFSSDPKTADVFAGSKGDPGMSQFEEGANIKPLYISMKNPAGWEEYDKFGLGELKSRGYDGAILKDGDEITGFVFEPTQIKSAIGNKGTFNSKSSNINMSMVPEKRENIAEIYDRFLKQATDQGLNPAQASKWAKERMTGKPETVQIPKAKQLEFGAEGGVQGFGKGREGENELNFSMAPAKVEPQESVIKRIGTHLEESAREIREIASPASVAPLAKEIGSEELGRMARGYDKAEAALAEAKKFWDKQSQEAFIDFYDRMEHGESQPSSDLDAMAKPLRQIMDDDRKDVQDLGTGKLQSFNENYLPHIWEQEGEKFNQAIDKAAKRPFEGKKAFLKKRTIETLKEGIEAGLTPVSWNPVDLVLLKHREIQKYVMAHRWLNAYKETGFSKYIKIGGDVPEGWKKIDDRISTVFKSPMIAVQEAFDEEMMNKLNAVADSLGIDLERKVNLGRKKGLHAGVWGYSESAEGQAGKITTKFGGPESVMAHELGHQLDSIYGLQGKFLTPESENEFARLANQRAPEDADEKFKQYIQTPTERMAVMLESYIHAPELFKEVAPNLFSKFEDFLNSKPELKPLTEVKPSLVMGTAESEVHAGGAVIAGHIWAHPDAARIINNYLSPGLQGSKIYQTVRMASNLQNQAQLGFSAFHAGFVTTNSWVGQLALAINQLELGHPLKAVLAAVQVPVAPIKDIISGNNIAKAWRGEGRAGMDEVMANAMEMGGGRARMDQFYQNRMMDYLKKNFKEGNYVRGILQAPFALIEATSKPVLEWMVPRMKMGAFANIMRMEMEHSPNMTHQEARTTSQAAWRTIDNRLGQLVYDNIFWNRTFKDALMLAFRSVGWNLGSGSLLFGGIKELGQIPYEKATGQKAKAHYDAAYLIALPVMMGIVNAIYQYLKTGKGPDELKDYVYPKNGGTDQDGRPSRSAFASYEKDFMGFAKAPVQTVINKINPMISDLYRMYTNQDFFGVKIRNEDDPIMKQLAQEIGYKLKQMTPFSISNLERNLSTGRHSTADILESWTGINPAPWNVNQTPAEKLAHEFQANHFQIGGRTQAQANKSRLVNLLEREYKNDNTQGRKEMQTDLDQGRISQRDIHNIIINSNLTPLQKIVRRLDLDEMERVYAKANDEEKAQIEPMIERKNITSQRGLIPQEVQ